MNEDIDTRIVDFMEKQKKSVSKTDFSTREIADAIDLTIYQARGHLEVLLASRVIGKVNSGRGVPGKWRLL